jgi:chromosome segregation ATPase
MTGMATPRKKPIKAVEFPETARLMPATQGMVRLVRDELVQRIDAAEERSAARDEGLRTGIVELQGRVASLDAKFDALDAKIDTKFNELGHEMRAKFHELHAMRARDLALNEEQTAQNGIALEAVTGMIDRQNRLEKSLGELRELIHELVHSLRKP